MTSLIRIKRYGLSAKDIISVNAVGFDSEHTDNEAYNSIFDSIESQGFALIKGVKIEVDNGLLLVSGTVSLLDLEDYSDMSEVSFAKLPSGTKFISAKFLKVFSDGTLQVGGIIHV